MSHQGKCPRCQSIITACNAEHVKIQTAPDKALHGVSFSCPACHVVINVQIDPVALNLDLLSKVQQMVKPE